VAGVVSIGKGRAGVGIIDQAKIRANVCFHIVHLITQVYKHMWWKNVRTMIIAKLWFIPSVVAKILYYLVQRFHNWIQGILCYLENY